MGLLLSFKTGVVSASLLVLGGLGFRVEGLGFRV